MHTEAKPTHIHTCPTTCSAYTQQSPLCAKLGTVITGRRCILSEHACRYTRHEMRHLSHCQVHVEQQTRCPSVLTQLNATIDIVKLTELPLLRLTQLTQQINRQQSTNVLPCVSTGGY